MILRMRITVRRRRFTRSIFFTTAPAQVGWSKATRLIICAEVLQNVSRESVWTRPIVWEWGGHKMDLGWTPTVEIWLIDAVYQGNLIFGRMFHPFFILIIQLSVHNMAQYVWTQTVTNAPSTRIPTYQLTATIVGQYMKNQNTVF